MTNATVAILRQPVTTEWSTPQPLFDVLHAEFGFTLDAAASDENAKCERYFTKETDGFDQRWVGETVFLNPPYGNEIGKWVCKGFEEAGRGATVVMLIPARTDTSWWHRYVMRSSEIRFIRGRVRFSGSPINAPFPSAVVVFRPIRSSAPVITAMDRYLDEVS